MGKSVEKVTASIHSVTLFISFVKTQTSLLLQLEVLLLTSLVSNDLLNTFQLLQDITRAIRIVVLLLPAAG
jgi:hypothetical protein